MQINFQHIQAAHCENGVTSNLLRYEGLDKITEPIRNVKPEIKAIVEQVLQLEKDKLFSVFNFPSVQIIEKLKSKFKATSLEEILKKKIDFSELSNILPHGFEEEFGVRLVESKLTESEEKISKVLLENKYSTYEWNYLRKNNQLNFQR